MKEYKLEIKQLVDYPRCRIYRDFIRELIRDKSIHSNGCSYFFCFMVLCSYANFRTSYRRIDGIQYTIYPGEWICKLSELTNWFRLKVQYKTIEMMDYLQKQNYIRFTLHGNKKIIKFKIYDWNKFNTVLEYNAPCQKDTGFFFFPISKANELIHMGKCSELDIVLDLWINTVYNEEQVQGSNVGPVVYFRDCSGDPFVSYAKMANRWNLSKSTVARMLNKFSNLEYITIISSQGKKGSIIYLNNYLSTMFNISDVVIDKDEIAMTLEINIKMTEKADDFVIDSEQISVSNKLLCVPDLHIKFIIQKIAKVLAATGVMCCGCPESKYMLYSYHSDCKDRLYLDILCRKTQEKMKYSFEIRIWSDEHGGKDNEK